MSHGQRVKAGMRAMLIVVGTALMVARGFTTEGPMMTVERIGVPVKAICYGNSHGLLGTSPQGRTGMFYIPYYSTTGGGLAGYHAASGEVAHFRLHSAGGYGLCLGGDGALYVGGVTPGNLQRVLPSSGEVQNLGGTEFGVKFIWDLDTSPDGMRVYGACWPTGNVIEYDVASGQLRDLGRAVAGEDYVRSVCVDHRGMVWAGVGTNAHLVVYDPPTGRRRDVLPPQWRSCSMCYDTVSSGRYVITSVLYNAPLLVFDADTEQVVRTVPLAPGQLWWMNCKGGVAGEAWLYTSPDGDLYRYRIEADELTLMAEGLGQCEQVVDGRYVHGIADQSYFLYDLQERRYLVQQVLAEAKDGMAICTLTGHSDGKVYGSTYINQHLFSYDPVSGALTDLGKVIRAGGQVDSIHSGRDGRIYMGSYVRAHLSVYDPGRPWRPGTESDSNPRELGELGHGQYRTRAIALGPDGRIWVGSVPSYNSGPTGALSVWDPKSGEHRSWLDLVPGGAVTCIEVGDQHLYGCGGGRVFVWDPKSEHKLVEIELPAQDLVLTEAGLLVASGGQLVLLEPQTLQERGRFESAVGEIVDLCRAPDGSVYGVNQKTVCRILPGTATVMRVADSGGSLVAVDSAGTVYLARGAELWRLVPAR